MKKLFLFILSIFCIAQEKPIHASGADSTLLSLAKSFALSQIATAENKTKPLILTLLGFSILSMTKTIIPCFADKFSKAFVKIEDYNKQLTLEDETAPDLITKGELNRLKKLMTIIKNIEKKTEITLTQCFIAKKGTFNLGAKKS